MICGVPLDVLWCIVEFLPINAFMMLTATCREFYLLREEAAPWQIMVMRDFAQEGYHIEDYKVFVGVNKHIRELIRLFILTISTSDLLEILSYRNQINRKVMSLTYCYYLFDKWMIELYIGPTRIIQSVIRKFLPDIFQSISKMWGCSQENIEYMKRMLLCCY
jgi:hypothetical protein